MSEKRTQLINFRGVRFYILIYLTDIKINNSLRKSTNLCQ